MSFIQVPPEGGGSGAVDSVNGQIGVVVLAKGDIGLGNVDNTSDANKPVSTAQQTAIDAKVENNLTASTTVAPSKTQVNTALGLKVNKAGDTMTDALVITGNNGVEFAGVKVNNTNLTGFCAINARADDGEVIQINALNSGGTPYGAQQPGEFALYAKRNLNIIVDDASGEHRICGVNGVLRARFKSSGVVEVPAIDTPSMPVNCGPGTDGAGSINSNIALSRNTYYTTLNITNIGILRPQGFFINVQGALTIQGGGGITLDGGNGGNGAATTTGGTAGAAAQSNEIFGSLVGGVGGAGGATTGTQAAAVAAAICLVNATAGNGSAGGTGSSGAGGAARTGSASSFRPFYGITTTQFLTGIAAKYGGQSAPGGSGGGGDGTAGGGGGGGGAGGGVIMIFCDTLDNQGVIAARGGNGGNGGTPAAGNRGGGGGGGGGTGGFVYIICRRIINLGTILVTGGSGGTGGAGSGTGTAGGNGTAGGAGRYAVYETSTNTWTIA